jgi:hypothetical protein
MRCAALFFSGRPYLSRRHRVQRIDPAEKRGITAAATYDGSLMRLDLNGVQVDSVTKSGPLALNGAVPVSLGRSPDGASTHT